MTVLSLPAKKRRLKVIADQIAACRECDGMNIPGVTQSASAFGSPDSPVAIVGQSLCNKCMESGIPFTGGSGNYIDTALLQADKKKTDIFITNVVHCHPEGDRRSKRHEKDNCRHFLHAELAIVRPRLAIGLGEDAKVELRKLYPTGVELPWPFVRPRRRLAETTYLLFPAHPGSLRFEKTPDRAYWSPSLAAAIKWGFDGR